MRSITELITHLQEDSSLSFEVALAFFDDAEFCILAKEYKDEEGNHLIHCAIQALARKLENLYKPFEHKKSIYSHLLPHENTKICTESCLMLLKKMFEIDILPEPNFAGLQPLELLRTAPISVFFDKKTVLQQYLPFFENRGALYSGRKYISNLNFFRSSKKEWKVCVIPDAFPMLDNHDSAKLTLHERLALTEKNIRKGYISSAINLVVANLGFVISDLPKADPKHKPVFVTIPICIDDYQCFAEGQLFAGTHSEAALCYVLKTKIHLSRILTDLSALHPYVSGQKVYSIVLDLHSTAEVCKDCQGRLHALQTDYDENSFLKQLELLLLDEGYILPRKSYIDKQENALYPKLRLTLRASGIDDSSYYGNDSHDIMPAVFNEEPPSDVKNHPQKVFFHLPPTWNKYWMTNFASAEDQEKMGCYKTPYRTLLYQAFPNRGLNTPRILTKAEKEQKEQAKADYQQLMKTELSTRFPTHKLSLYYQTAFSNTGGRASSVHSSKIKQLETLDIEDQEIDDIFYSVSV